MLIDQTRLTHWIDNFYGYGSWQARCWFIGYEEGGGELPEDVADKVNYFQKALTGKGGLCDIRDLYKHVAFRWENRKADSFDNLFEYRFGKQAIQYSVWKNLILFAHSYHGKKIPALLPYQQKNFLSPSAHREALIFLYPLPSPHNHAWYYSWLDMPQLGFLKSRALYQEHLFEQRIQTILSNIRTHKPDVVVMYGMNNINVLKKSVQAFYSNTKFISVKATKLEIPQHHRADLNGTLMLITTQIPTLSHNRIETGFDWEAFGRMARE